MNHPRSEAQLQFNDARNAACLRVGAWGFDFKKHMAWFAAGSIFFNLHTITRDDGHKQVVSVAEVWGFFVVPEKKRLLIPGSDGEFDKHDWIALGLCLAPHAQYAWFEKQRELAGKHTDGYHPLAKYKERLRG